MIGHPTGDRLVVAGVFVGLALWLHGWIGLLFLAVGLDLLVGRRPLAPRPVCWPALGVAAVGMLLVDPMIAFGCGWLVELVHDPALVAGGEPDGIDEQEGDENGQDGLGGSS